MYGFSIEHYGENQLFGAEIVFYLLVLDIINLLNIETQVLLLPRNTV